ncbi:NAD(P)-dependent dehydrogenase (short-subunit alcohol dehydrogenase family) [Novosphingobium sp. PhB57]|uniref:glucose 1-dehydrogenase n=1 Tax=Novosphingobium sp. PhB57 TaxID=2485107 RepID=UPI00104A644B|nr:glucose 1-dehydrogenase [Novosphingobium sp. PhB57]TCU54692.1 NAD(P)-dependent dehydrogenase (short-subunit alcohol dehydrogenase family) [Novosphingobium sp. PhB57]
MNPKYDYAGKVALVTGASAGIGLATAKAYAEAGASVVLADIDTASVERAAADLVAAGHTAIGVTCDVSDENQAASLVAKADETYGALDMAFNNAGIAGPSGKLTDETAEEFDAVNGVNLRGVWACMKHEIIQMEKQGGGAIVNCSSLGGLVGQAGRAAYHGTKHGVIGLTKSAGVEYVSKGIQINAVCPGVIETPMLGDLMKRSPEAMEQVQRDQPIGRLGQPEEIAAAVLWLSSPAASFVAGAYLAVDGGFVAH